MILTSSVGWSLAVRTQTTQRARQLPGTLSRSAYTRVRPPGPPKPKPAVPSDRPFLPDAVRQRHASKDAPPLPSPPYTYEFEQSAAFSSRYYRVPDRDVSGRELLLPSVTTVLSRTTSHYNKMFLKNWRAKEVERKGEEAVALDKSQTLLYGSSLHWEIEQHFRRTQNMAETELVVDSSDTCSAYEVRLTAHDRFMRLSDSLTAFSDVAGIETAVAFPEECYAGTADLVARFDGKMSVIDWKTSKAPKLTLGACYDYPLQICAYAAAINYDQAHYDLMIEQCVIFVVHPLGVNVHVLDLEKCEKYWNKWKERTAQFRDTFLNQKSPYHE